MEDNEQEMYAGLVSEQCLAAMDTRQFASFLALSETIAQTISEYDQHHLTMTDFLSLVYCEAGNRGNITYEEYAYENEDSEEDDDPPDGIVIDASVIFRARKSDDVSSP